jgi:hypothetical protein
MRLYVLPCPEVRPVHRWALEVTHFLLQAAAVHRQQAQMRLPTSFDSACVTKHEARRVKHKARSAKREPAAGSSSAQTPSTWVARDELRLRSNYSRAYPGWRAITKQLHQAITKQFHQAITKQFHTLVSVTVSNALVKHNGCSIVTH